MNVSIPMEHKMVWQGLLALEQLKMLEKMGAV